MLIIGREIGQSVIIDRDVKVTAVQFASKLRLIVDAPENISVTRIMPDSSKLFKKRFKSIGDTVQIGKTISVTILQTENGLIRFAIDAPKEVKVFREELLHYRGMTEEKKTQIS